MINVCKLIAVKYVKNNVMMYDNLFIKKHKQQKFNVSVYMEYGDIKLIELEMLHDVIKILKKDETY